MTESSPKVFNVICGELCSTRECSSTELNLLDYDFNEIKANVLFDYKKFVATPEEVPKLVVDLLQIASYIFCADRMANRGSRESISNASWARTFQITIPVSEIEFWETDIVKQRLNDVLTFMTGDRKYEFTFVKSNIRAVSLEDPQLKLFSDAESEVLNATDADVMLFSGGLDSLAGAVERLNIYPDKKLCLVSHKSATVPLSIRNKLVDGEDGLRQTYGNRIIKYDFECRNKGMKTREETQRTRMFLFSAIAFAICNRLNKNELYIYENGVTSINIPLQVDAINARASRTTHPKTIGLLEQFYKLLNPEFSIKTPYQSNTKAEIVSIFKKYNAEKFIANSVSCSSSRNKPKGTPHCGICSQCIDRRFAMYAVGVADEDDVYERNFITENNNNETRNRLLNLIMFADKIKSSSAFELWAQSPTDFLDIISFWQGNNLENKAAEIHNLLNRFADSVFTASKAMIKDSYSSEISISPNSLLRILLSQNGFVLPTDIQPETHTRDSVFISYARADKACIKAIEPFLKGLERDCNITYWYDGKIVSGENGDEAIRKHMLRARVAILLVSQHFLVSDYIRNIELPELVDASKNEGVKILWLPISYCNWELTPIADYQAAAGTNPNKPLSVISVPKRNEIYLRLSQEIKDAFNADL